MIRLKTSLLTIALAAIAAISLVSTAQADDRRLITGFEEIPTVLFLFDTSGSMHWSSQCTQADFDAGNCDYLCPTGSCFVPGNGDSEYSKFYQAKAAIYEALIDTDEINVGFATFNQDDLRMRRKHWLYEALSDGPYIPNWGNYPRARTVDGAGNTVEGDWHVFGDSWSCFAGPNGANNDDDIGCSTARPADLNDQWEHDRVQAWSKETPDFNSNNDMTYYNYVRDPSMQMWRIRHRILNADPHTLGNASITTRIARERCLNNDCSSRDMFEEQTIIWGLTTDFDAWDVNTARGPYQSGFFSQGDVRDGIAGNTCQNWDANTDTPNDIWSNYNTRWPTVADGTFPGLMDVGDVLPIDWRSDNKQALLERLAPNLALGDTVPDFRVATYFEDIIVPNDELHLKDSRARPILSFGATPIGTSVQSFYNWVSGGGGWAEVAAANDPSFTCRRTYLIIVSDGNQSTCDGNDPCDTRSTKELFDNLGIKTFVVAFGVPPHTPYLPVCIPGDPDADPNVNCCAGAGEPGCILSNDNSIPPDAWPPNGAGRENRSLRCMASTGGTGNEDYDGDGTIDGEGPGVIYPQNQDELKNALVSILDSLQPAPASFSTAAVPSVQAEAADKVFLSEFTPIPARSNWMGRVNAFLKPVPVDDEDRPDTTVLCPFDDIEDPQDDPSACLLWEAGDVILNNQVNVGDPVGDLPTQRRIYYAEFSDDVPQTRHFFEETIDGVTPVTQEFDLWNGFNLDFDPLDTGTFAAARDDGNTVIDSVLGVRTTPVDQNFPVAIDYILDDIFHSDPLLLGSPTNLLYFFENLHDYRDFAIDHAFRRRVLLFGSNGGLVHGLDAGVCRELTRDDPRPCLFDNGSGRELFGIVPRSAMPTLSRKALDNVPQHRFGVDGRTQAGDVRIDPKHEGRLSAIDPPVEDDREWRTVLIGGLREGGHRVPLDRGDLINPEDANTNDTVLPSNQSQSGYFAIDLTQPDPLETLPPGENRPPIPEAVGVTPPSCLQSLDGVTPSDPDCGTIAYGSVLWEFTDSIEGVRLDEDNNGHVDLAFAWSNPNIGRILVCTSGCSSSDPELEDRYVTIVGGGFDPDSPYLRGNFVYLIDIETGETIYKHSVLGAVAAEPAGVDTDFNGYLDTIYIGTTLGMLYRVNISAFDTDNDANTAPKYPEIETVVISETDIAGNVVTMTTERILDTDFSPHILLETTDPLAIPPVTRPIFFRPSVAFMTEFNRYAVAIGTGNREDIFRRDEPTGRFFAFVDNISHFDITALTFTPLSPASSALTPLNPTSPRLEQVELLKPGEGWWMELAVNERIVTEPFALSGILFFSTFIPDPGGPVVIPEASLCREQGVSNLYGVFTNNADGLLSDDPDINDPDQLVRYVSVSGLVSSPFTEQAQTKNPPPDSNVDIIDDLSPHLKYVRDRLKQQFPENCTFPPGYRTDVKTRNSGTSIDFIAPVPLCVVEKAYREF